MDEPPGDDLSSSLISRMGFSLTHQRLFVLCKSRVIFIACFICEKNVTNAKFCLPTSWHVLNDCPSHKVSRGCFRTTCQLKLSCYVTTKEQGLCHVQFYEPKKLLPLHFCIFLFEKEQLFCDRPNNFQHPHTRTGWWMPSQNWRFMALGLPYEGRCGPRFRASPRASHEPHPWVSRCWHIAPVGSAMKT